VGAGDDLAGGRLPEHFGQANDRHHSAIDQVPQGIPRTDGGKLIHVADHDQSRGFRQGAEQGLHEEHVHHRGLIDNEKIAVQWLIFIALELARRRVDFQQAMNSLCLQAGGLRETLGSPSGGSAQQTLHSLGSQNHQDRVHQGRLAYTGTARDDGGATGQHGLQRFPLARGERLLRPLLTPCDGLLEIDPWIDRRGCSQQLNLRRDAFLGSDCPTRRDSQGLAKSS